MIHFTDYVHDVTNSTTSDVQEFVTYTTTLIEGVDLCFDDDERLYETFLEGWRFRFDHWHMHPWHLPIKSLEPTPKRPRRIEESGNKRRWTSGFL